MNNIQLKEFRERLELTHGQIANLLAITRVSYTRYENGVRNIPGYIKRSISFFQKLGQQEQQKEIEQVKIV